jgi:hypothetical protein
MILGNTTRPVRFIASCFETNDPTKEDSNGENMKQPLIIMGNESLKEDEEQETKLSKERPSRSIVCIRSFLFGSFITFAAQAIAFAPCHALAHMYDGNKDPQKTTAPGSLVRSEPEAVIFIILFTILYAIILYTLTAKYDRCLFYMRIKVDKEDATASNPSSGSSSFWTERMFCFLGLYFAVGALVGSVFFMGTGMGLPWSPDLTTMVIGWVLFLITVECFEWRRSHNRDETTDHELEDDSGFLV